ncbi:MAG TPA: hypothetical protein VNY06_01870, partial [Methylocella sp.]|nr:hypothetical protein [Methylocella sp.]
GHAILLSEARLLTLDLQTGRARPVTALPTMIPTSRREVCYRASGLVLWRKCEVRPYPLYGPYWRESRLSASHLHPPSVSRTPAARVLRDARTRGTSRVNL